MSANFLINCLCIGNHVMGIFYKSGLLVQKMVVHYRGDAATLRGHAL
jgi:hypothetical protein